MDENQKVILTLLLFLITYIYFVVSSNSQQNADLANESISQVKPIESDLDLNISPQPLLPNTPFEHNQQCSCDQDILVHNDTLNTCYCETRTRKNCVCETCTCQSTPCKNMSDKFHRLQ